MSFQNDHTNSDIAVIGIGAIEQHGRHLPIGTDWMIIQELSRQVAHELNAWLIPAIPVSMSECHGLMEGTIWIKPATLSAVLQDIANSLYAKGIHKLVVLNGHGGNFVLAPTIQTIMKNNPDMVVVMPSDIWPSRDDDSIIFEKPETDIHAGEIETSIMEYLYPELVKKERRDFVPDVNREFLDYVTMDKINPEGIWGIPSKGNSDKGARTFLAQVKVITFLVQQAFRMIG